VKDRILTVIFVGRVSPKQELYSVIAVCPKWVQTLSQKQCYYVSGYYCTFTHYLVLL